MAASAYHRSDSLRWCLDLDLSDHGLSLAHFETVYDKEILGFAKFLMPDSEAG
jgi:hypothetical protein